MAQTLNRVKRKRIQSTRVLVEISMMAFSEEINILKSKSLKQIHQPTQKQQNNSSSLQALFYCLQNACSKDKYCLCTKIYNHFAKIMPLQLIQYLALKIQKPQLKGLTMHQEKIEKNKFSTISLLKNRFPFLYFYSSVFFIIKSKLIYLMEIKTEQIESYAQTNFTITPKQNKTKKFQRQPWTIIENKLYIKFLRDNLQTFKNAEERRNSKVFKKMEASIQSRSARQIKSHHQKLMIKYNKSIESIIVQVEKEMRLTQYGTALDRRMVAPRLFIDPIMQNNQFLAYEDFVIPSFHTQSLLDKLLCIDSNYEYPCEAQNLSNS